MAAPQDPGYCGREKAAKFRRRRLGVLAAVCALSLVVFGLVSTGPSDSAIEGNQRTAEASR